MGRKSKQNFRHKRQFFPKKSVFAVSPSSALQYLVKTLSQSYLRQPLSSSLPFMQLYHTIENKSSCHSLCSILHSFKVLVDFFFKVVYNKRRLVVYSSVGLYKWVESCIQHNSTIQNGSITPQFPICCSLSSAPPSIPALGNHRPVFCP